MAEGRPPLEREFSAGGVCVRRMRGRRFVAVVRLKDGKVRALPKGHYEEGESGAQAARREVREETGIDSEVLEKLGDVRYWYARGGVRVMKNVAFFLCWYKSGRLEDHDDEVEAAEWLALEAAATRLSYKGERRMVEAALERLGGES